MDPASKDPPSSPRSRPHGLKRLLLAVARSAVEVFYRHKRLGGAIPAEGPLLLVANHPNGLVDPVVVASRTERDVRLLAKAPLFDMPVLGSLVKSFGALPVWRAQDGAGTARNEATFEAVWDALAAGDVVAIFPEGRSHSEPSLLPLKSGAARMALGAEARVAARGGRLGVRIVPIGLVYTNKDSFRSHAASWVGEAIEVGDLVLLHARDERAAAHALSERIAEGLSKVTVNLEDWEDLPLLALAERIWQPARGPRRVERMAALAEGLRELRASRPERVRPLEARVAEFGERLERLGLDVDRLEARAGPARVAAFLARNLLALVLGLPLAVAGVLLWFLPFQLVRLLARWRRPSPDLTATVKLLAGLVVYPAWYAAGIALAWSWRGGGAALVLAALAPGLGLFALRFAERRGAALEDAAVFLRLFLARSLRERLRRRRAELAEEIEALAAEVPRPPRAALRPD